MILKNAKAEVIKFTKLLLEIRMYLDIDSDGISD